MTMGWIGIDLDGSIAEYHSGDFFKYGAFHIGKPIIPVVNIAKNAIAEGYEVRIFTARMSDPDEKVRNKISEAIGDWTERFVGVRLKATCIKDYDMVCFYDDRAIQLEPNTGRIVG